MNRKTQRQINYILKKTPLEDECKESDVVETLKEALEECQHGWFDQAIILCIKKGELLNVKSVMTKLEALGYLEVAKLNIWSEMDTTDDGDEDDDDDVKV